MSRQGRRGGFTLVELLVVIGIIALLISILLPALNKAREAANTVKCSANLHSIGLGVAMYESNNKGKIPASVIFAGMILSGGQQYGPAHTQAATDIFGKGYVNWTSQIFTKSYDTNDPAFGHLGGVFDVFTCPSLPGGGVAPANTFAANQTAPCVNEAAGVLDAQAPRLAYMLNEALTPRGRLGFGVPGTTIKHPYHYVSAGRVRNAADTVLGTENWGVQALMLTKDQITSAYTASNSRRPVSGVSVSRSQANGAALGSASAENLYSATAPQNFLPALAANLRPDPSGNTAWATGTIETTLDFVGRNHGPKKFGTVAGGTISGWDLRKSNFLYVDGHVDTKNIVDTVYPVSQWGDQFYDLVP